MADKVEIIIEHEGESISITFLLIRKHIVKAADRGQLTEGCLQMMHSWSVLSEREERES